MKLEFSRQFRKYIPNFMQIRPVGAETDMLKPTFAFRNIANVPKKDLISVRNLKLATMQEVHWSTDSVVPRKFFGWGSTNSVEDRGQRERESGDGSPLLRGSAQLANE
jgi:hypothetical protein